MKILLFYMSHRQFREIAVSAAFASRFSKDLRSADIYLYCNNPKIPKQELEALLAGFPNSNKELVHTSKNIGYYFGGMEATADSYPRFLEQPYDWVIHIQTDVYITDEEKILAALREADRKGAYFLSSPLFEVDAEAYTSDFFAWKPSLIPKEAFESYLDYSKQPGFIPEVFLYRMIHRLQIPHHFVIRYRGRGWMREIDELGLWHLHSTARAEFYLRTGVYVPLGRYKTVENFFRRQYRRVFPKVRLQRGPDGSPPVSQA